MPPPMRKRRKLNHSTDDGDSVNSTSSFSVEDTSITQEGSALEVEDENSAVEAASSIEDGTAEKGSNPASNLYYTQNVVEDVAPAPDAEAPSRADIARTLPNGVKRAKEHRPRYAENAAYAGEIYKSNMFKMQIDELLHEVRLKDGKREALAEQALRQLKMVIEGIPDRGGVSVVEAEKIMRARYSVAVPFPEPRPPKDAKYTLAYAKPTNINVGGSYPLKVATRIDGLLSIDLIVTMPSTLFQEKDYLNYRYFYKRAYYVACLAAGIQEAADSTFELSFQHLNGNPLQPILIARPISDELIKTKAKICITPAISQDVFSTDKLLPDRNCVRSTVTDEARTAPSAEPTPFYNGCIRSDSTVVSYLKLLHAVSSISEAFRDACILGRIWLRQRGLGSACGKGGFGNFEWATLTALLLRGGGPNGKPLLSKGYSSYQLFKALLQFLSSRDLMHQGLILPGGKVASFKGQTGPVIFDEARSLNLLFKMTSWSYRLLRYEARTSVAMLGESLFDQFEPTFIVKEHDMLLKFDLIVKMPLSTLLSNTDQSVTTSLMGHSRKIYTTLARGLGDRVKLISIIVPENEDWSLGKSHPQHDPKAFILIAIIVDPANADRSVDHGPSAEDKKEANSFRMFWGDKAELRRFKDGSILESLVWSTKDSPQGIVEQIISYILARHMGPSTAKDASFFGGAFGLLLPGGPKSGGVASFQPLITAYNALEQHIRDLADFPLQVRQILGADPQLRYSSVNIPLSHVHHASTVPANVILQFGGSGRWPDDLTAIERTKIAFLLKLGESLESSVDGIITRLGLENQNQGLQNQSFLDVIYPTGASFRLRIHHDRVQSLIETRLKDKLLDQKLREDAGTALAAYKRTFVRSPSHTQAIQTLCTKFAMLSPSIRLMKKWCNSHLLSCHFAPEVIELLVVHSFVLPYPWQPPSSIITGFLRTLFFISRWDWRNEPLIVDFNNDMQATDVSAITTRFEAWRKIDPALNRIVLFAASNIDAEGTTWTDGQPSRVAAARLSSLAKAAIHLVKIRGLDLRPETLFSSPLADYDFVIHLNPQYIGNVGGRKSSSKTGFKNLQLQTPEDVNLLGFDPVSSFLAELRALYGQGIVFFHDCDGGSVIAGLWSPHTKPRSWKVNLPYATVPTHPPHVDDPVVEVNRVGILNEIARLGNDLIKEIKVNR